VAKKKKLPYPLRLLSLLRRLLPLSPLLRLRKPLLRPLLPLRKLLPSNRVSDHFEKPPLGGFSAF